MTAPSESDATHKLAARRGGDASIPTIEIICVTYRQPGPLKVLVQSFLNQTAPNWRLSVWHDGPDDEFDAIMRAFVQEAPGRIRFACTQQRHNDWGHSLRARGLGDVTGDYVLITNGDNYYVPKFIEILTREILSKQADVVMFDMIHSHTNPGNRRAPSYSFFPTALERRRIDMGAAIVRADIARAVGFRARGHDADGVYFEDVKAFRGPDLTLSKIERVLFVHN